MDIKVQNVRPEFVQLLKYNGLTLENWYKFKELFITKDVKEKTVYEKTLLIILEIRKKYREKNIFIKEIETLFLDDLKNIQITGSKKNKNSKGKKSGL